MPTGDIRIEDGRGRHTTTRRQLVRSPCGALMIDPPGMRELGDPEGISAAFPGIEALRFRFSTTPTLASQAALSARRWTAANPPRKVGLVL
jgi:hypothetical protein